VERTFEVGDLVYLRLHPYRQASIKKNGTEKLKPHFYGPYRVKRKVGKLHMSLSYPQKEKYITFFMCHV
jgi:hypothetical protein